MNNRDGKMLLVVAGLLLALALIMGKPGASRGTLGGGEPCYSPTHKQTNGSCR